MAQTKSLRPANLALLLMNQQFQTQVGIDSNFALQRVKVIDEQLQRKIVYVPIPLGFLDNTSDFYPTFLTKLSALLEKHYTDELFGVPKLSQLLCLCPMQVHRKLKKLTGISPGQYLLHFRLSKAVHLIIETDFTLGEIAYRTGFSSLNNFSRVFKRVLGISASGLK